MTSVAPSDSASNTPTKQRRNRPGKNQRKSTRDGSAVASTQSGASFFASQVSADPVPQPGKYPVVFRTSVEEPSQDVNFAYSPDSLSGVLKDLPERYTYNPRYAEFSDHATIETEAFMQDLQRMFVLAVAQQTIFAHVNMRLSLGDFSSIANTEVPMFTSLAAVIGQFGEYSDPSLGTRFILRDYRATIHSLVRLAKDLGQVAVDNDNAVRRMWLPTSPNDERTRFIVATRLSNLVFDKLSIRIPVQEFESYIFKEEMPLFETLKTIMGDKPDRFDFLFKPLGDEGAITNRFTLNGAPAALEELGLPWKKPSAGHLNFSLVPKVEFPILADSLLRKRPAWSRFFHMVNSSANRTSAAGTHSQLSKVTVNAGVSLVQTHVAISAPELSLLVCFPPSAVVSDTGPLNVRSTTTVPTTNRATEFLQMDWKQ